jgi:hypothetical protein
MLRSGGIDISFSGVNESVMTVFKRTHLLERIGENHIFPTMEKAIQTVHYNTHKDGREEHCPLTTFCSMADNIN